MKKVILYMLLTAMMSSCCMIISYPANKERELSDVSEVIIIDSNKYALVHFGVADGSFDQRSAYDDSEYSFRYVLSIDVRDTSYQRQNNPYPAHIMINSLVFTTAKGDTLPYVVFYRDTSDDARKPHNIIHILPVESFPVMVNADMSRFPRGNSFIIIAECREPWSKVKEIYVYYDVEINENHYVGKYLYKNRLFLDCRPKFF